MFLSRGALCLLILSLGVVACDDASSGSSIETDAVAGDATLLTDATVVDAEPPFIRPPGPSNDGPNSGIYAFANACVTIDGAAFGQRDIGFIGANGETFRFDADEAGAARFRMQPSGLGTFLLYDVEARYLAASDEGLLRPAELESDVLRVEDGYISPAEWALEVSSQDATRFALRNRATDMLLSVDGLAADAANAAIVTLYPSDGCAEFPEMSLDAAGTPERTTWEDGDVYGIVESHAHLLTNFGFGGGGIFHGAPFHPLGVEHALSSCEQFHEADGRRDIIGFAIGGDTDAAGTIQALIGGRTPEFAHNADGYPTFTDWPNSWKQRTHQMMYHRWLERAWRGGLRLFVQHATGNSVLCELVAGAGWQQVRYSCNDMVSVDRQLAEARNMEAYIDALNGGPGQGWFRIVESPAEARAVIEEGKMAVLLGIEISNLFDCFVNPKEGFEVCTPDTVRAKLDRYHDLGVRGIFPVHKYDNGFSAGDGQRGIIEMGNFANSGHWSNFVEDCPNEPNVFDKGSVVFGGANQPRAQYDAPAPNDLSGFFTDPIAVLLRYAGVLTEPAIEGQFCQNAGLTPLGETLILEMMKRGMIIEVDHLPQRAAARAYELLAENDYPGAATHGNNKNGEVYDTGGVSNTSLGRCADPDDPKAMIQRLHDRVALKVERGGYPAEGFAFDMNGLAAGPRPRFGDDSRCAQPQPNPIDYPFTSVDGAVTFTAPQLGERAVDFNTEGMIHIGLLPELIEDVRRNGVTDDDLEPLFRSAESYLRMWEKAEARAAALR
ncbi:MAG: microsomal dipeptidase-like Zn-dependent dipeptidase [Bradymonadia bacterium]|jgi:microsomal dipeptidase-like Zn-dependent dipeptidase